MHKSNKKEKTVTDPSVSSTLSKSKDAGMSLRCEYSTMKIEPLVVSFESCILLGSVVENSTIVSAGQELGPGYDMSASVDDNTGKTFSHVWDAN